MVDICERIHCKKLHISDIEIAFDDGVIGNTNKINLYIDLDKADRLGLISDGQGGIVTHTLPSITNDIGIINGKVDMFTNSNELVIAYNKPFNNIPKIFLSLLIDKSDRYINTDVTEQTLFAFKLVSRFEANKRVEMIFEQISMTRCINLYYSGIGIVSRNQDNTLYFVNNQSFDGSGQYRYHSVSKDEVNPDYGLVLSVDGYPMVAYSRKVNNNLILGECNSMTGLGQWTFTTNGFIGLYPNLIVTDTRRVAVINYDGTRLVSSIIDNGTWFSHKIDSCELTGISACSMDKYQILVATKSDSALGCRIYIGQSSGDEWLLGFTSNKIWLHTDVGMLADNRPLVVANSLDGVRMYYNTLTNGTGIWNTIKLLDDTVTELKYLLLGNGDSAIVYRYNDLLHIMYGDLINLNYQTIILGDMKNISVNNTHNGYVNIVGLMNDKLTSIISAYKYRFADDLSSYKVHWYAEDA